MAESSKKGKKNRKHGRNKDYCKAYFVSGRREKNKAKKLAKHIARHPNDPCANRALEKVGGRRKAAS